MKPSHDPIGQAILDFVESKSSTNIIVESDLCDDDVIATNYLFRTYEEMPEIERVALSKASGKVLDIGACAGCHSNYLKSKNIDVTALDKSEGACSFLNSVNIKTVFSDILSYNENKFETILLLMNGLGLAENLAKLPNFLSHLKSLLKPNGKIICDSSDIKYLYEDDEGAIWIDLNSSYYGEMKFNMKYKDSESGWFDWLYVDQETLSETCNSIGLECKIIFEGENHHYLAELKPQK